ncbi:MAG: serine/threonine protein kinase [Planctomycetota bacterium]|nr:MAG: serine/threonine protein kinase [Planctomycetota bacterium]REJ96392.1 MAG: serine/threonine protein kinase [Planctomycetota bacterium]REK29663.1 MAG: serine/threonine protein kinase [Planctomycetota bacterium]REK30517.1 MAG: serine/threonine protein kinase [Planctomycetota bacterium]
MQSSPTEQSSIYCPGCNELFRHDTASEGCPRCGVSLVPGGGSTAVCPTLLWKVGSGDLPHDPTLCSAEDREMRSLIGRELGIYQCESLLGRGGMGWVYLARHRDLERRCAVKILAPGLLAQDEGYLRRFLNEGRAAAALVHPNVVTTHAVGRHDNYHFLEMEFVAGRSLQDLIEAGPIPPIRAMVLTAQIAEGLAAAHRSDILHRDLKPDNILLTHRGIPKIGDFGLAKRVAADRAEGPHDELVGTPNFMAPELFAGQAVTPAADVYAMGVCLFLMLTRRLPYARSRLADLIEAVTNDPVPSVRELCPQVPLEMAECVGMLMAKAPANRPQNGTEALQLLEAVLGHLRDLESILQDALGSVPGIERRRRGEANEFIVALPDGRRQTVVVEQTGASAAERLLQIYSVCCPAEPHYLESALRLNSTVCHGALAVRDIDGKPHFVMIDTYPRSTVDPEEVRRSVMEIANHADAVECRLTDTDNN